MDDSMDGVDPGAVAMSSLWLWQQAVREQCHRVLNDNRGVQVARQLDAWLLLMAFRQVIRAAEMAHRHASDGGRQTIRDALDASNEALAGAVTARDMLEHFDEYALGKGRLQRTDPSLRFTTYWEESAASYVLHVGPFAIDVKLADEHARQLKFAVHAGLSQQGPVLMDRGEVWRMPLPETPSSS